MNDVILIIICLGGAIGGIAGVAYLLERRNKPSGASQPMSPGSADDLIKIEATIAKKAQGSLIYALFGILGFSAIVVCPLAFIRANQALRLIDEYHVGEQHRGAANGARIIAPLIFLFYAAIAVFFVGSGIVGIWLGM